MSLWLERMNELTHYGDYLREANQDRLARQVREECQGNQTVRYRAMRWLGSLLSAWGTQLLTRCGSAAAATAAAQIQ
jgi:hypothetical protein